MMSKVSWAAIVPVTTRPDSPAGRGFGDGTDRRTAARLWLTLLRSAFTRLGEASTLAEQDRRRRLVLRLCLLLSTSDEGEPELDLSLHGLPGLCFLLAAGGTGLAISTLPLGGAVPCGEGDRPADSLSGGAHGGGTMTGGLGAGVSALPAAPLAPLLPPPCVAVGFEVPHFLQAVFFANWFSQHRGHCQSLLRHLLFLPMLAAQ